MAEHRVRLTDEDVALIVSALRARTAGISGKRRRRTIWLAGRLENMSPGNPHLNEERPREAPSAYTVTTFDDEQDMDGELAAGYVYE